jgi:uncharacterized protein (DUF1330 family)
MMAAYIVAQLKVHDPAMFQRYREAVTPLVDRFGGRYRLRGGELDVLEGDWQPSRLVLLAFDDLAAARRWYDSEGYRAARRLRAAAARLRMVAVQGLD